MLSRSAHGVPCAMMDEFEQLLQHIVCAHHDYASRVHDCLPTTPSKMKFSVGVPEESEDLEMMGFWGEGRKRLIIEANISAYWAVIDFGGDELMLHCENGYLPPEIPTWGELRDRHMADRSAVAVHIMAKRITANHDWHDQSPNMGLHHPLLRHMEKAAGAPK